MEEKSPFSLYIKVPDSASASVVPSTALNPPFTPLSADMRALQKSGETNTERRPPPSANVSLCDGVPCTPINPKRPVVVLQNPPKKPRVGPNSSLAIKLPASRVPQYSVLGITKPIWSLRALELNAKLGVQAAEPLVLCSSRDEQLPPIRAPQGSVLEITQPIWSLREPELTAKLDVQTTKPKEQVVVCPPRDDQLAQMRESQDAVLGTTQRTLELNAKVRARVAKLREPLVVRRQEGQAQNTRHRDEKISEFEILKPLTSHTGQAKAFYSEDKNSFLVYTPESPIMLNNARYKCPSCTRTYKLRKHARRHMFSHTGLAYACPLCGRRYERQDSCRRHAAECRGTPHRH